MSTTFSQARFDGQPDTRRPVKRFVESYLIHRAVVGALGIALPVVLIVGDMWLLEGSVQIRGSLSAYYHTSMRDWFVGVLVAIGVLLLTYKASEWRTRSFRWSTAAAFGALGVAVLPTERPGLTADAIRCGDPGPTPPGCTALQERLGETLTAQAHFASALLFIAALCMLAFLFAHAERVDAKRVGESRRSELILVACGGVLVLAAAVAFGGAMLGIAVGPLTALYLGEVIAVLAFGLAWLVRAWFLYHRLSLTPADDEDLPVMT